MRKDMTDRLAARAVFLLVCLSAAGCSGPGATPGSREAGAWLDDGGGARLRDRARIDLERAAPATDREAAHIRSLIAELAAIRTQTFGISGTLSGTAFAPVPDQQDVGALVFTQHEVVTPKPFRELVHLGPRALPFLLESLDDPTPTKLTFRLEGIFTAMWLANELKGNPLSAAEREAIAALPVEEVEAWETGVDTYTVKVGDVCFVAIGQIVGRPYQAVRYQPSGCRVVCSPTSDPELTRVVRRIWSSDHPAQRVLDSLLIDFASVALPAPSHDPPADDDGHEGNPRSDRWLTDCESLQRGAALRLLYYFPDQTASMVLGRLVETPLELHEAVVWCPDPSVQSELRRLFRGTSDPELLSACLPVYGKADRPFVRRRMLELIHALPASEADPRGDGYVLLMPFGTMFPDEFRGVLARYVRARSVQRRMTLCTVLAEMGPPWASELLGPLLADTRPLPHVDFAWSPSLPVDTAGRTIRVCDEAAGALSRIYKGLTFKLAGEQADLDRQIAAMRKALAAGVHVK